MRHNSKMEVSKSSSFSGDALYSLPTPSEQRALRETTELLNSSILTLGVTELLEEIRPRYKAALDEALKTLHSTLKGIAPMSISADSLSRDMQQSLALHLLHPKGIHLDFVPPSKMDIIGSYLLRAVSKPQLNVDVSVVMPKSCFHNKDHMNRRYTDKRALYLYVIVQALLARPDSFADVHLTGFAGDSSKPVIEYSPVGVKGKFKVRIYPALAKDSGMISKLAPQRNNVRRRVFPDAPQPATPQYNNSLLEDMFLYDHLSALHAVVLSCPAFAEAIMLVKVWHTQRNPLRSSDGFNGFLLSMILLTLLERKTISKQMTATQMFRICMESLAALPLDTEQVGMSRKDIADVPAPPLDLTASAAVVFDVVMIDASGWLNLCSRVSKEAARSLRHDAAISAAALAAGGLGSFEGVFMSSVPFWNKFDQYVTIPVPVAYCMEEGTLTLNDADHLTDLDPQVMFRRHVASLLQQALGDRVRLIRTLATTSDRREWLVGSPSRDASQWVTVGLLLAEDDLASRRIDKGPAADDTEAAAKFRAFWRSKSELRRFKDGTITETVVWEGDKHSIPGSIVKFALETHMPFVRQADVRVIATQLDSWLPGGARGLSHTLSASNALEELAKALKGLQSKLPMPVKDVVSTSSSLRYTAVVPPVPHVLAGAPEVMLSSTSSIVDAIEVLVTFTPSTRWPEDKDAIAAVKGSLYVKMAEALKLSPELAMSGRTLAGVRAAEGCLLVFYGGYVFRCTIFHDREVGLLRSSGRGEDEALANAMTLNFVALPALSSTLKGFHWKHAAFGGTARLAKRWLAAHMLSGHVSEVAVELIVAHLFISPAPLAAPSSALVGFLRFICLLANFEWENFPLVVDLNGSLSSDDLTAIETAFASLKASGVQCMYVVSSLDRSQGWLPQWSRHNPQRAVIAHMQAIAHRCVALMQDVMAGRVGDAAWSQLFTPSLSAFDVIIDCDVAVLPPLHAEDEAAAASALKKRGKAFKLKVFKNLLGTAWEDLLVEFHPLRSYVVELSHRYGDSALFFYDEVAGDRVGIVWKPAAFMPHPFSVSSASDAIPLSDSSLVPDIFSIASCMAAMAEGILSKRHHLIEGLHLERSLIFNMYIE